MEKYSTVELINEVSEFVALNEFMQDEELLEAMAAVVKIMSNPDIPPGKALALLTRLQAMAFKFSMNATYYTTLAKGPAGTANNTKKNVYYTAAAALEKLCETLKYSVRHGAAL